MSVVYLVQYKVLGIETKATHGNESFVVFVFEVLFQYTRNAE
jgi:hypothetical protein